MKESYHKMWGLCYEKKVVAKKADYRPIAIMPVVAFCGN